MSSKTCLSLSTLGLYSLSTATKFRHSLTHAWANCKQHVFKADISLAIGTKLYKTTICSLLTYDSETWYLDALTISMMNGANAHPSSLILLTDKDAHVGASERTPSYDLVRALHKTSPQGSGSGIF